MVVTGCITATQFSLLYSSRHVNSLDPNGISIISLAIFADAALSVAIAHIHAAHALWPDISHS